MIDVDEYLREHRIIIPEKISIDTLKMFLNLGSIPLFMATINNKKFPFFYTNALGVDSMLFDKIAPFTVKQKQKLYTEIEMAIRVKLFNGVKIHKDSQVYEIINMAFNNMMRKILFSK